MPKRAFVASIVVAALSAAAVPAAAQSVADFYKGRTITLLIGVGVGGGTDAWARTLAKHIGRFIPGNPSVVPQNMPGAGGLKLTNYLYNAAPKDGLVFGLPNAGIAIEPLLGAQGANFDPMKLNWIGSPDRDTTVCVARKEAPVQSIDDLRTQELIMGASGSGGNTNIFPMFLTNVLGMKMKVIKGYKGTQDILLAMERGEVMGLCSTYTPLSRQSMFKAGKLRVLFQATLTRDKAIDAPSPTKFIKTDAQRMALEFFLAREELGRPFVAPPDVPNDRIQALRRAFDETMKDSEFVADVTKQRFDVVATTGEQLTAIVARIYKTPKDVVKMTAVALGRGR